MGIVLASGGLLLTDSVWTLPLVIVGAVMVLVAWIGHRLEDRIDVEWGKTGTELAFRATVKAARPELPIVTTSVADPPPAANPTPASPEDQVIEGEAHTVEVDVGELKSLIAAVEAEPSAVATERRSQEIHIHRVVNGAGHTPSNGSH